MIQMIASRSDAHLLALHRCAKTRARAFFMHPRALMVLRNEIERRGLASWRLE